MAKMWQGRFTKELDKRVNDFNSSIAFDSRLYKQDIQGSIAHVTMLGHQGIVSEDEAKQIVDGLEKILAIKDTPYYERIYGIFISLRNADAPITANVARIIKGRYLELRDGKRDTEFTVRQKDTQSVDSEDVEALKQRLAAVEKLLAEKAKEEKSGTSDTDCEKPKEIRRTSKTKTATSSRTVNK